MGLSAAAPAGTDLRLFQLWVLVPLGASLVCCACFSRLVADPLARCFIVLQAATLILLSNRFEAAMRADVWLLCFAALQLAAALFGEELWAVVAVAVCGAALIDLKVSALPLAFIAPAVYYVRTRRLLPALAMLLQVPLAAAAFLVRNTSAQSYL